MDFVLSCKVFPGKPGGLSWKTSAKTKLPAKMKIVISHGQDSIDPSGIYSDDRFEVVKKSLESEYETAILKEHPGAEIDFGGNDSTYAIRVWSSQDDPSEKEIDIQRICEEVFEKGNFWE